ncbi:hypothetical protein N0V84_009793 [Fusarium piperis]|uniref:Rhodopsin domain-containing protein n=1 Tax=Fusarium piperis TaxID=1435070 RepID=A0A9W8W5P2_9HYPO|nr:hypothetical protein N0V84_009793 [Fusarium piperis]
MAGYQLNTYLAVSITWFAALLSLIARVFARRMTKIRWWWDDYLCLGAFVFCCSYCIVLITWTVKWYMGQTLEPWLSEEKREDILLHSRFMQFLVSLNYSYAIGLSKLSILLFYRRIFKQSAIRIPIQLMLGITAIWLILRTFMVIFHCIPVQAYWDQSIKNATCNINDTQFFFGTCLTHFLMDIIILALPVIEVFKLRLRLGQKFAITALFVVGFIVCLASMFVIIESIRYDTKTTQMPRDMALNNIWGCVEINIAIVSGCFPLLRPIFRRILPSSFLSSTGSSHPISRSTHAIRLTTLNRTNKEKEIDESSSTHNLADPEHGLGGTSEFETIDNKDGIQTVITSQTQASRLSRDHGDAGIYVRSDMVVVEEHTYAMKR